MSEASENASSERISSSLSHFVRELGNIPAGYDLPEGFEQNWEAMLVEHESEARKYRAVGLRKPERVAKLVRRGWITIDRELFTLKEHLRRPSDTEHAIPVVLVSDYGHWSCTTALLLTVRFHPIFRAIADELGQLTTRERIQLLLKFAGRPTKPKENLGAMLQQRGAILELLMKPDADEFPESYRWMSDAEELKQFWEIVAAAIEFGKRWAQWELHGDGRIDALFTQSLTAQDGRPVSRLREEVESSLDDFLREKGKLPTAKELLKWLGGSRPKSSDQEPLVFRQKRWIQFREVTWPLFNETVKSAKKKRK